MAFSSSDPSSSPDYRTWLASLDDDALATLLQARPDVIHPLPPSIAPLARRLELKSSITHAVRSLNAAELAALEAAADLGADWEPIPRTQILEHLAQHAPNLEKSAAGESIDKLIEVGLLYGDEHLRLLSAAPAALPPAWSLLEDPAAPSADSIEKLLNALGQKELSILHTLAAGSGVGTTRDAAAGADPARPVPRLIQAGLLTQVDANHVRLPRKVAQILRGQDATDYPLAPGHWEIAPGEKPVYQDTAGAGQGLEAARQMRSLLELIGHTPPTLNKDSTLGARAHTRLAANLGVTESEVARLLAVAAGARLVGRGEPPEAEGTMVLAPSRYGLEWLDLPLAEQWAQLLHGWWLSPWRWWLVGTEKDGLTLRFFAKATRSEALPHRRRLLAKILLRGREAIDEERLRHSLRFHHPLLSAALPHEELAALYSEAEWVGALGAGAPTSWLALLDEGKDLEDIAAATAAITPVETTMVIVQADLTVLAPGPLTPEMYRELTLFADLESPGLASVFRLNEQSLRRGLDAGRSVSDIRAWLGSHCPTELPAALLYLLDDLSRTHGSLRGGAALSYLRSDDPALLDAAQTRLPEVLSRLAPTVAVSMLPLARLIEMLGNAGLHASAEDTTGALIDIRPDPVVVPAEKLRPLTSPEADSARIQAAVRALRAGEANSAEVVEYSGSDSLGVLQAALRGKRVVRIGVVDKQGRTIERRVRPVTIHAGQVDAVEPSSGAVARFPIHRITHVATD